MAVTTNQYLTDCFINRYMFDVFNDHLSGNNCFFNNYKTSFYNCKQHNPNMLKFDIPSLKLKSCFNILCLNCHSIINKMDRLKILIQETDISFDVICLSETWLNSSNDSLICLDGYRFLNKNRTKGVGGGTAIFINNSMDCLVRDDIFVLNDGNDVTFESIATEINNQDGQNIIIINIYRPPVTNVNLFLDQFEDLMNAVMKEQKLVCIMGDLNIDFSIETPQSLCFLNLMSSFSMYPNINIPTRTTATSSTIIDVFFTNSLEFFFSGTLLSDLSDHYPIFLAFPFLDGGDCENHISYHDTTLKNLNKLNVALSDHDWSDILDEKDCHLAFDNFVTTFENLFTKFCPYTSRKINRFKFSQLWMTNEIKKLIRKKNCLFRKYKETFSINHEIMYKKFRNKLNNLIKTTKINYYHNVFNNSNFKMKEKWKLVNNILNKSKKQNDITLVNNGATVKDNKEIANIFNNYFINLFASKSATNKEFQRFLSDTNPPYSLYFSPTNPCEVIKIVNSFSNSTSLDHNKISNKILKHVINSVSVILSHLFNISMSSGVFPNCFKIARVVPIHKSNSVHNVENYRPISILSSVSKILEKIVEVRLDSYLDVNSVITKNQFGFRKKRSTENAVMSVVNEIVFGLGAEMSVSVVFLDFAKAFDSVPHDILLMKLESYGIRGIPLEWFASYLSERLQYVNIKGFNSTLRQVGSGVPQGSILGPKLFNVFINDVVNAVNQSTLAIYADDTTMITMHHKISDLEVNTNIGLHNINNWAFINKIGLNIKKTKYIVFTKKKNILNDFTLRIGDKLIERVDEFKLLGIIIDSKMTFKTHINSILLKINRNIGIINRIKNQLTDKFLLSLYYAFIYSHLFYGNLIWGNTYKTYLQKIYVLQKRALKIISFRRNINIDIFNKLRILPIYEINYFKSCCFIHKVLNSNNQFTDKYLLESFVKQTRDGKLVYTRSSVEFLLKDKLIKNTISDRNICFYGVKKWNRLPLYIRSCLIYMPFKYKLKEFLLCLA